jgi:hypothetical protein
MEKKRAGKSRGKAVRSVSPAKRNLCSLCKARPNNALVVAHSLYRKYSFVQNHFYLMQFNSIQDKLSDSVSTADGEEEEYLSRYHRAHSRKQVL